MEQNQASPRIANQGKINQAEHPTPDPFIRAPSPFPAAAECVMIVLVIRWLRAVAARLDSAVVFLSDRGRCSVVHSDSPKAPSPPTAKRWRRVLRLATLLLGCMVALAIVLGVLWTRDRGLREAEAALRRDEPKYALYLVTKSLDRQPDQNRALALKARVLVALGRPAEAISLFDRVGVASAEDVHACARALLMQERWSLALPLLARAVQMKPDDSDALYELTACRVRLGMFDEALESARQFAELPGNQARGYLFVGTIHNDLGNFAKAADSFAQVLQVAPDAEGLQVTADEFLRQYGQILLSLGQPGEARQMLERSIELGATSDAHRLLGDAMLQLGQSPEAVRCWTDALETDQDNLEARQALANAALQAGAADKALRWLRPLGNRPDVRASTAYLFQRAYTVLKHEDAAVWQKKAVALRERERFNAAIQSVLRDQPQSFWARVIRTHHFASAGNWQQAEVMVAALGRTAPNEAFVADLADAIRRRGPPPPLERLPLKQY